MAFQAKDWQDSPSTTTPLSAAALEDLETRLGRFGTVNASDADVLVKPTVATENGVIVKAPNQTWRTTGDDADPNTAQAFALYKEGTPPSNDDVVMFRVTGGASMGMAGNIHLATGTKQDAGYASAYAMWIDPTIDTIGIIIDAYNDAPTSDYLICRSNTVATPRFKVTAQGNVEVSNHDAGRVAIGNVAGLPTILFGSAGDTNLFRSAANILSTSDNFTVNEGAATELFLGDVFGFSGIVFGSAGDTFLGRDAANSVATGSGDRLKIQDSYLEVDEIADPAAPAVDGARLFVRDSPTTPGKTELAVRFNTGAVQVLATQP